VVKEEMIVEATDLNAHHVEVMTAEAVVVKEDRQQAEIEDQRNKFLTN
jgi:hypothetical protein